MNKTKIEIKSRWLGASVLFSSERETVKEALRDAVLQGAVLRGADLQGADLRGAVLRGADLQGAVLRGADLRDAVLRGADLQDAVLQGADLRGADLRDADLRGAVLQGAVLRGAVLQGAVLQGAVLRDADLQGAVLRGAVLQGAVLQGADDLPQSYVNMCSRDMLFIFNSLKKELPGLKKAILEGRISGTQYEGECACLIGTLANIDGGLDNICSAIPYYDKGLHNPAEQWFYQIRKGDTPDNNFFAKHALKLIDSILE